jgi:hypothetical protein
VSEVI